MGSAVIYRQEIIQDITLLTSEPKARFYSAPFSHLDLSDSPDNVAKAGRKEFSNHAKLRCAVVMKCECFSCITDLVDTSFITPDSTPVMANTSQNNPKSFKKDKFKPDNQPKSDATIPVSSKPDGKGYGFTV